MKEVFRTDVGFQISLNAQQQATGHQSVVEHFANQVQNGVARGGGCRLVFTGGRWLTAMKVFVCSPNYVGFNVWGLDEG